MNIARLFKRYGTIGTVQRKTYDFSTGLPSATASAQIPIVLVPRSQIEHGVDTLPVSEFEVKISHDLLVAASFPVPIKDGDLVEVAGISGTIRMAPQSQWKGQIVYRCRCEGVNS